MAQSSREEFERNVGGRYLGFFGNDDHLHCLQYAPTSAVEIGRTYATLTRRYRKQTMATPVHVPSGNFLLGVAISPSTWSPSVYGLHLAGMSSWLELT